MKKWRLSALLVVGLLLFTAILSDAGGRHHGGGGHGHRFHGGGSRFFVGIGPVWPAQWWYAPPPVYAYAPPPVIVQPAPVYVAPPPPPQYWYLCQSFNAYYPQTPTCPEPWLLVPARPY
jgi:hypothetical protein